MSTTYTLDLDYQRLLNFANGTTVSGYTITTVASAVPFMSGGMAVDPGQAITVLQYSNPSWALKYVIAENAKVIYFFQATY